MNSGLTGIIRKHNLPLGEIIEDNAGFRICGSSDILFTLESKNSNRWIHINQEHMLKVESQINLFESNIVITNTLKNMGKQLSIPVNVIEPLYLIFKQPSENWRHIYAKGGLWLLNIAK